jgi:5-methyltetrahydropteroyltriglutamate--homocysteine methyltransferase
MVEQPGSGPLATPSPARTTPPFRVEHIGSFLRPARLLDAARQAKAGEIDPEEYRRRQDRAIVDVVRLQESLGLGSITDGEFRRRGWSAGFIDAVSGFGMREDGGLRSLAFRSESASVGMPASPYARARLRRVRPIVADDLRFLQTVVRRGVPKVTMPSPTVMHYFLGAKAVDPAVYPDVEEYFDDLARIYREEIAELAAGGGRFVQLDDTALPCNCDARARAELTGRGDDPDGLTARYVRLINDAVRGRPASMGVGIHLCRGNLKGMWMAEGGYEPIADRLFNGLDVDAYFLEYDTPRAGDFSPLRLVPPGRLVVLGLVSTKTPLLESKDEIRRRLDEAARFVPIERLGVSPQCGFASAGGAGQVLTEDDVRRKVALLQEVATAVWG